MHSTKKAKHEIKLLCTPDGFVLNVLPYFREKTVYDENGHAFSVVYGLLNDYMAIDHTVYMDNCYTSVELATSSYKNETHVVGTLKKEL